MISRRAVGLGIALCLLAACEDENLPLAPAWGKERCGHCAMVVGDKRFAAQAVTARGERLFFDDPGCLASYELEHPAPRRAWVLSEGQWLDAATAHFTAGAHSPMDYGFEARQRGTLDWASVKKASRELNLVGAR
jgi:copper chaperone NosL